LQGNSDGSLPIQKSITPAFFALVSIKGFATTNIDAAPPEKIGCPSPGSFLISFTGLNPLLPCQGLWPEAPSAAPLLFAPYCGLAALREDFIVSPSPG
jgi:hypothetical protein